MATKVRSDPEITKFAKRLRDVGGSGHYRVFWKGKQVGGLASSPRAFNLQAKINDLRQGGFDLIEEERKKLRADIRERERKLAEVHARNAEAAKRVVEHAKNATPRVAPEWTKERCLQAAKDWQTLFPGKSLRTRDWSAGGAKEHGFELKVDFPPHWVVNSVFGTWAEFLAAAGMAPNPKGIIGPRGRKKNYRREDVLRGATDFTKATRILPLAAILDGRAEAATQWGFDSQEHLQRTLNRYGVPTTNVVTKLFGSVEKLREAIIDQLDAEGWHGTLQAGYGKVVQIAATVRSNGTVEEVKTMVTEMLPQPVTETTPVEVAKAELQTRPKAGEQLLREAARLEAAARELRLIAEDIAKMDDAAELKAQLRALLG
jgi:phosphoribosylformylglycinamidine (FGAM) synthase PurS component